MQAASAARQKRLRTPPTTTQRTLPCVFALLPVELLLRIAQYLPLDERQTVMSCVRRSERQRCDAIDSTADSKCRRCDIKPPSYYYRPISRDGFGPAALLRRRPALRATAMELHRLGLTNAGERAWHAALVQCHGLRRVAVVRCTPPAAAAVLVRALAPLPTLTRLSVEHLGTDTDTGGAQQCALDLSQCTQLHHLTLRRLSPHCGVVLPGNGAGLRLLYLQSVHVVGGERHYPTLRIVHAYDVQCTEWVCLSAGPALKEVHISHGARVTLVPSSPPVREPALRMYELHQWYTTVPHCTFPAEYVMPGATCTYVSVMECPIRQPSLSLQCDDECCDALYAWPMPRMVLLRLQPPRDPVLAQGATLHTSALSCTNTSLHLAARDAATTPYDVRAGTHMALVYSEVIPVAGDDALRLLWAGGGYGRVLLVKTALPRTLYIDMQMVQTGSRVVQAYPVLPEWLSMRPGHEMSLPAVLWTNQAPWHLFDVVLAACPGVEEIVISAAATIEQHNARPLRVSLYVESMPHLRTIRIANNIAVRWRPRNCPLLQPPSLQMVETAATDS